MLPDNAFAAVMVISMAAHTASVAALVDGFDASVVGTLIDVIENVAELNYSIYPLQPLFIPFTPQARRICLSHTPFSNIEPTRILRDDGPKRLINTPSKD